MDYIVKNAEIENTKAFQGLEKFSQNIALKLTSKKIISSGFIIHKTTGVIPGSVGGNNLRILKELIEKTKT